MQPEVDISGFLEKQRIKLSESINETAVSGFAEEEDVDHTLAHISSRGIGQPKRSLKKETIHWDASLDEMKREKEGAEAMWGMKSHAYISKIYKLMHAQL